MSMRFIDFPDLQEVQEVTEEPASISTPYDTIWAQQEIPVQGPVGSERFMLAQDKLFVVLAVVLIIWMGIVYFIFRTDRKILDLERSIEERT